jgi:hypothetical protein
MDTAPAMREGKLNEASKSQVTKAFSDISKLSVAMLLNLEKFKAAKAKGDEKVIDKHRKIAYDLQTKKKKMEADLDKMIAGIDKDVELVMDEGGKGSGRKKGSTTSRPRKIDMDRVFMKGRTKKRTTDEGKVNENFVDHFLDRDENKVNNIKFWNAIESGKVGKIDKRTVTALARKFKVDPKDAIRFVREMFTTMLENKLSEAKMYKTGDWISGKPAGSNKEIQGQVVNMKQLRGTLVYIIKAKDGKKWAIHQSELSMREGKIHEGTVIGLNDLKDGYYGIADELADMKSHIEAVRNTPAGMEWETDKLGKGGFRKEIILFQKMERLFNTSKLGRVL